MKKRLRSLGPVFLVSVPMLAMVTFLGARALRTPDGQSQDTTLSFKRDVFPVIKKNCLPCHAEDNFNPSELSLDSYELLMKGGKHGSPVVPGKSAESIIVKKLGANPPFGRRMPEDPKKRRSEPSNLKLPDSDIALIARWIDQGAKDN